ncbi:MAG: hydroxyacid dehydrogenase [Syntrophales bacterium]|nr:hydroxyacid dehydrogenase [Syntrophales bacterium]
MTSRFKVLLYEPMHTEGTKLLEEKCDVIYAKSFEESKLVSLVGEVDAIVIRANGVVSRAVIDAAKRLKVIGRHGVGLDGIDLETAKERGIKVVYTPVANTESVAEHFVGLALTLAKKMRSGDIALREGKWNARYELIGTELRGKTLGLLGFGRIGQQTARICHYGFSMPVMYYDVINYPLVEAELGAFRRKMEEVCREADFVSINLPMIPETRNLVNADLIRHMKPSAFLINMARGPIWNEADVAEAIKSGRIAGAGSDVFEVEPALPGNPLFAMDNFVGTPHMSAHTDEGMSRMSLVAKDVLAVLEGEKPEFPAPGSC